MHFTLRTDQAPLNWILFLTEASVRLEKGRLHQLEYKFDVVLCPRVKLKEANALSRISTDGGNKTSLEDSKPCLNLCSAEEYEHLEGVKVEGCKSCGQFVGLPEETAIAEEEKKLPITIEEFQKESKTEAYCEEAPSTVRHSASLFDIDRESVLLRRALLDGVL